MWCGRSGDVSHVSYAGRGRIPLPCPLPRYAIACGQGSPGCHSAPAALQHWHYRAQGTPQRRGAAPGASSCDECGCHPPTKRLHRGIGLPSLAAMTIRSLLLRHRVMSAVVSNYQRVLRFRSSGKENLMNQKMITTYIEGRLSESPRYYSQNRSGRVVSCGNQRQSSPV